MAHVYLPHLQKILAAVLQKQPALFNKRGILLHDNAYSECNHGHDLNIGLVSFFDLSILFHDVGQSDYYLVLAIDN